MALWSENGPSQSMSVGTRRELADESVSAREESLTEMTQSFLEEQLNRADMAAQKANAAFQNAEADVARCVDFLNERIAEFNKINDLWRNFIGADIPEPVRYAAPSRITHES